MADVVFDCGSISTKLQFCGRSAAPFALFPSIVGRPNYHGAYIAMNTRDCYVGDLVIQSELLIGRGNGSIKYPIQNSVVKNFNDAEKLWHHSFYNEMRICPEETTLLYADSPFTPLKDRSKIISIFFETFNVSKFGIAVGEFLATYASDSFYTNGENTCLVVEIGGQITRAVPIINGKVYLSKIKKIPVGGQKITENMQKRMIRQSKKSDNLNLLILETQQEKMKTIFRDIKKNQSFAAKSRCDIVTSLYQSFSNANKIIKKNYANFSYEEYLQDIKNEYESIYTNLFKILPSEMLGLIHQYYFPGFSASDNKYTLPDGKEIQITKECLSMESLFNPKITLSVEKPPKISEKEEGYLQGIQNLIYTCINQFDNNDIRKKLFSNIVLSGETSMTSGISQRISKELSDLEGEDGKKLIGKDEKIFVSKGRSWRVSQGGDVFISNSANKSYLVDNDEYNDVGPDVLLKRKYSKYINQN